MDITKREIIISIAIIAIMLTLGIVIGNGINRRHDDKMAEYNKALKMEDQEIFEYGMRTNIGNAFVYGELDTVDTVEYEEVDGQWMYLKKNTERYTRYTRTVTYTDSNGNTKTRQEVYWTWDVIATESKRATLITFLNVEFPIEKIKVPSYWHIDTVSAGFRLRHVYYGTKPTHVGTVYTKLRDNTILDGSEFHKDYNIEETVKNKSSNWGIVMFWLFWIVLIGGAVYGFCYLDNQWAESR